MKKQLLSEKLIVPDSLSYRNKKNKKELKENKIKTGILHTIYLLHEAKLKDIRPACTTWTITWLPFLYSTFKRRNKLQIFQIG